MAPARQPPPPGGPAGALAGRPRRPACLARAPPVHRRARGRGAAAGRGGPRVPARALHRRLVRLPDQRRQPRPRADPAGRLPDPAVAAGPVPQPAAGHQRAAPDGNRDRGHRLCGAPPLGPARLGRDRRHHAHPLRPAADHAGVRHLARHPVRAAGHGRGGAAADPADPGRLAVRRGRPAARLVCAGARERPGDHRAGARVPADPPGGLARIRGRRRRVRTARARLHGGPLQQLRRLQHHRQRRFLPVVAHDELRQLRGDQAAAPPAPAVPGPAAAAGELAGPGVVRSRTAARAGPGPVPVAAARVVAPRRPPGHEPPQQCAGHAIRPGCRAGPARRLPGHRGQGGHADLPGDRPGHLVPHHALHRAAGRPPAAPLLPA